MNIHTTSLLYNVYYMTNLCPLTMRCLNDHTAAQSVEVRDHVTLTINYQLLQFYLWPFFHTVRLLEFQFCTCTFLFFSCNILVGIWKGYNCQVGGGITYFMMSHRNVHDVACGCILMMYHCLFVLKVLFCLHLVSTDLSHAGRLLGLLFRYDDYSLGTIQKTLLGLEAFEGAPRFHHSSEGAPIFCQSSEGGGFCPKY